MNQLKMLILMPLLVVLMAVAIGCLYLLYKTPPEMPDPTPTVEAEMPTPASPVPPPKQVNAIGAPEEVPPDVPAAQDASVSEEETVQPAQFVRYSGVVLDARSDAPITDAEVQFLLSDKSLGSTVTDQDGAYTLTLREDETKEARDESYAKAPFLIDMNRGTLQCRAVGYSLNSKTFGDREFSDGEEIRTDFFLKTGATVTGRILDAESNEGLADMQVSISAANKGFRERVEQRGAKTTDISEEDGSYQLSNLSPGTYQIRAHPEKSPYYMPSNSAITLSIQAGDMHEHIDLKLAKGATVTGLVSDEGGQPIANAFVNVIPGSVFDTILSDIESMQNFDHLNAQTDEEGFYTILGLPLEAKYVLQARSEGYASGGSELFEIAGQSITVTKDLVLGQGSTVSGRILYDDGTPAAKLNVMLFPDISDLMQGHRGDPQNTETDDQGGFVYSGVGQGKYTIMPGGMDAMAFNPLEKRDGQVTIDVDGTRDIANLEITLAKTADTDSAAQGTIAGRVVDANNGPVAQVNVQAYAIMTPMLSGQATTDANGNFTLTALTAGQYDITVDSDLGKGSLKGVAQGSQVTIRLAAPTLVSGQVVDASGQAAQNCPVSLKSQAEDADFDMGSFQRSILGMGGGAATTDEFGYFEFRNVEVGDYTIKAKSPTLGYGESSPFSITEGGERTGLQLKLKAGVKVSGQVEDKSGSSISGAKVTISLSEGSDLMSQISQMMPGMFQQSDASASTDEDGRFELSNVEPGIHVINVSHGSYAPWRDQEFDVPENGVSQLSVLLSSGGTVEGRVVVDGEAKSGAMIQLMGGPEMKMATTDEEGNFTIGNVAPASYMAQAINLAAAMSGDMSNMLFGQKVVDVESDETYYLDFSPEEGAVTVSGVISGFRGTMTVVSLRREGGPAPEDVNQMDMASVVDQVRFAGGQAFASEDGSYVIRGVKPGEYILEIVASSATDALAMASEAPLPRVREEVVVEADGLNVFDFYIPVEEGAGE
jgi:protocatechuate 3,4-dioxygenase beta subunit